MLGVSQTAFADGKSKNNAEFVRLTEEMSQHLSKNLYSAADGDFVSAMKLHGITVYRSIPPSAPQSNSRRRRFLRPANSQVVFRSASTR